MNDERFPLEPRVDTERGIVSVYLPTPLLLNLLNQAMNESDGPCACAGGALLQLCLETPEEARALGYQLLDSANRMQLPGHSLPDTIAGKSLEYMRQLPKPDILTDGDPKALYDTDPAHSKGVDDLLKAIREVEADAVAPDETGEAGHGENSDTTAIYPGILRGIQSLLGKRSRRSRR